MMTNKYEEKLKQFIQENEVESEHLVFSKPCRTVEEAAKAVGTEASDFIKSIVFSDGTDVPIVFIVCGDDRLDNRKVTELAGVKKIRMAKPDEILELTGYPLGGVPPFGFPGSFFVDGRVLDRESVFAGGGSENSLVKVPVGEIMQATGAEVVDVRE